jgi:hypothetical protein
MTLQMNVHLLDTGPQGSIMPILMRTQHMALIVTAMAVCAAPISRADIALGAPGVPAGSQVATGVPFTKSLTVTSSYKFVFTGIEAKGNTAGAPGNSGSNGNGGQFHVTATVSDNAETPKTKSESLSFVIVAELNSSPLQTVLVTPTVVYRAITTPINITLQWEGQGNAHKPDAIFNILGEYQKAPPVPTGSLNFAVGEWMLQTEGPQQPEGIVTIARE